MSDRSTDEGQARWTDGTDRLATRAPPFDPKPEVEFRFSASRGSAAEGEHRATAARRAAAAAAVNTCIGRSYFGHPFSILS